MLSFILVPLYTDPSVLSRAEYGEVSFIFAYFVLFNVVLAYGMETAFFRFFNKEENQKNVLNTSATSLTVSSLAVLGIAFLFRNQISSLIENKFHNPLSTFPCVSRKATFREKSITTQVLNTIPNFSFPFR